MYCDVNVLIFSSSCIDSWCLINHKINPTLKNKTSQSAPQINQAQQPVITNQPQPHKAQIVNQQQPQQIVVTQKQPPALISSSTSNQIVTSNPQLIQGSSEIFKSVNNICFSTLCINKR